MNSEEITVIIMLCYHSTAAELNYYRKTSKFFSSYSLRHSRFSAKQLNEKLVNFSSSRWGGRKVENF